MDCQIVDTAAADATESIDADLVKRALCGGADTFRPIVDRFQSAVFAVALPRVRDFHLAEDVAQQVFLEAYQKLDSLKDPAKLGGWLRSITIRKSANAIRSSRNEVAIKQDGSDGLLVGDANEDLDREDLKQRVGKAIGSLRPTQRETTTLFYIDGYSIGEIATILSVPPGTVKRRLHDARAKLKTEMVDLVKDTLTSERPSDDFGDQVHKMIRQYATERDGQWIHTHNRIVDLGLGGIEGLQKAMASPHGMTRWVVPKLIAAFHRKATTDDQREGLVEILKDCLNDPNKQVRKSAINALFHLDVSKERKREEFVPMVIERQMDTLKGLQVVSPASILCPYGEEILSKRADPLGHILDAGFRPKQHEGLNTRGAPKAANMSNWSDDCAGMLTLPWSDWPSSNTVRSQKCSISCLTRNELLLMLEIAGFSSVEVTGDFTARKPGSMRKRSTSCQWQFPCPERLINGKRNHCGTFSRTIGSGGIALRSD